ncbi:MAG: hypothetical protein AAB222_03180, partial [Candidatus Binatota bacterium]
WLIANLSASRRSLLDDYQGEIGSEWIFQLSLVKERFLYVNDSDPFILHGLFKIHPTDQKQNQIVF